MILPILASPKGLDTRTKATTAILGRPITLVLPLSAQAPAPVGTDNYVFVYDYCVPVIELRSLQKRIRARSL